MSDRSSTKASDGPGGVRRATSSRRGVLAGALVAGLAAVAGGRFSLAQDASTPLANASTASGSAETATAAIVAAANAFLATLSDDERESVLFA